mmetsp:Transcript_13688/g.29706  ORF Transcript_13688/g.29706 Transcript_13688/m.29706 type:complete len:217 (+) Transcript_13688:432-1082(+)
MGTHPRCVQMPSTTSHSGWRVRSSSVSSSRRKSRDTAASPAISAGVLWRMNTGFPRHLTVMVFPRATSDTSNSAEARASTSADALMEETNFTTRTRAVEAYANRTPERRRYVKARRSGSAIRSMRSSVKAWSTEPSSWRAGALGAGRVVETLAVCWKAAPAARRPAELMAAAPPRGRSWVEALEERREARRRAFMVAMLLASPGLRAGCWGRCSAQ